jgi:glucose/arabinose dehydrogenase
MDLKRLSLTVAVAGLTLSGCSGGGDGGGAKPTGPAAASPSSAGPAEPVPTAALEPKSAAPEEPGPIKLQKIAELDQPTGLAVRKGDPNLYVIQQPGQVAAVRDGRTAEVLDLTAKVGNGGNEQGLLGIAFSPDGGYVYFDYTNKSGDTEIAEYRVTGDARIDPGSARLVLTQDQPYENHNGGQLAFDKDGHLYIGLGDGGSGGDPHGNGQNLGTFLGKILRIDPRAGKPYKVPSTNPFVGKKGAKPEIWAYGLRNPWRFSFDSENGDLWIGDVGQDAYEEIDHQPAGSKGGENYGWNQREGSHPFKAAHPVGVEPVLDYRLHEGNACSVIGGFVYRGTALTGLTGRYLYADFCAGWIKALELTDGKVSSRWDLQDGLSNISAFGRDAAGELYVLSLDGPVSKIVPE